MRLLIRSLAALFAAWLLLNGAASTASAGGVKALSSYSNAGGTNYTIGFKLQGFNNGKVRSTVVGGDFSTSVWKNIPTTGPPSYSLKTWCVDLLRNLSSPPPRDAVVTTTSGAANQTTSNGTVLTRNIGAAGWLAKNISAGDSIQKAALQIAIWEALYDNDGNLNAGKFILSTADSQIVSAAQTYLSQALAAGGGVFAKSSTLFIKYSKGDSQDQVGNIIPEPTTLVMAATAGIVFLGMGWRRRREIHGLAKPIA